MQVYAVRQAPVPFPFELDLGGRDTNAYRGPGWSVDEGDIAGANGIWVDGENAEIYLPLRFDDPQPLQLVLRVQPFAYPNAPEQTLSAEFNGVDLGKQSLAAGWQEVRFAVPAEATRSGLNRLWLHFGDSARPLDVLPGQGVIGSTGVRLPVDVEINSGGAAQDIAFITVTDPDGISHGRVRRPARLQPDRHRPAHRQGVGQTRLRHLGQHRRGRSAGRVRGGFARRARSCSARRATMPAAS